MYKGRLVIFSLELKKASIMPPGRTTRDHASMNLIEEWGYQELKRVPYECAVEMPLGEIEDLVEKALGAAGDVWFSRKSPSPKH